MIIQFVLTSCCNFPEKAAMNCAPGNTPVRSTRTPNGDGDKSSQVEGHCGRLFNLRRVLWLWQIITAVTNDELLSPRDLWRLISLGPIMTL